MARVWDCKTEKKTLPISLVGFSKERIHVAMITKALPLPVWDANANVYPTGSGIVTGFPFARFDI